MLRIQDQRHGVQVNEADERMCQKVPSHIRKHAGTATTVSGNENIELLEEIAMLSVLVRHDLRRPTSSQSWLSCVSWTNFLIPNTTCYISRRRWNTIEVASVGWEDDSCTLARREERCCTGCIRCPGRIATSSAIYVGRGTDAIIEELPVASGDHTTIIGADDRYRVSLDVADINVDSPTKSVTFDEAVLDVRLVPNLDNAIPVRWKLVHSRLSGRKSHDTGMLVGRLKFFLVLVLTDSE